MLKRTRDMLHNSGGLFRNARDWLALDEGLVQASRTPFEIIHATETVKLRYYPPLEADSVEINGETVPVEKNAFPVPLVLVAPLAVNMHLYDLFPDRSLVKYLRARGFELYLVDWGKPERRHDDYNLYTYFGELLPPLLERVREHSGSRQLSLHGWSFGGLFCYCHAALGDPDIANLVLVGAPNDYHANGQLGKLYQRLSKGVHALERVAGWRVHKTRGRYWRSPGWANALAFKLTNPVGSLQGYLDLLKQLDDREFVSKHATNAAFLDRMEAYPGAVVQDFIQHLFADNVLAEGHLPAANSEARLDAIQAPILSVVGEQDMIVAEGCAAPLLEQVGSEDKTMIRVDGGHMGIVSNRKAPVQSWPQIADWLAARSGASHVEQAVG